MRAEGVGLVSLDAAGLWRGGRYYLHHLVRSVGALPPASRPPLYDVAWGAKPADDAFAEVRPWLAGSRVIAPPRGLPGRLRRRLRNRLSGRADARDLFAAAGIGALFPIAPCERPGAPFAFWLSDFQYRRLPHLFTEEMRSGLQRHFDSNVSEARIVVLSSRNAFGDFCEFYPSHAAKARVLKFCSAPDEDWFALSPEAARKAHGVTAPYLIACNQFAHHKNYETLFEAMRALRDRGVDARLVCTGSAHGFQGPGYHERLMRWIDRNRLGASINVLGLVPRAEQIALMRGARAVLQPSRFEGWSTVIEDAKTLGRPVLASDFPVHREQLCAGGGRLVAMNDAEAWADEIERALEGPEPPIRTRADIELAAATRSRATGRAFVEIMRETARDG